MNTQVKRYRFLNSETHHVISYYSIPADTSEEKKLALLESQREKIAIQNKIYVYHIYWEEIVE